MTFTVEVDFTDRTRTNGSFTSFTRVADVLAGGPVEAMLVAAQLVSCRAGDGMVIATRITDVAI